MRATAALLEDHGGKFVLADVELEDPRPDEVLVRIAGVGVCGTDLEFAKFFPKPAVLGHEGAGVVERVGDHVTSVRPGDLVGMSFASCGTCSLCRAGHPAYCRSFDALNFTGRRPDGTSAVSREGEAVNAHFLGQSSFATHAVVPERAVVPVAAGTDLTHVGPFGCGFQTGAGGVLNVLRPRPGSTLAVFGAGAVGAAAIIAAHLSGCGAVIAVDVNPRKLEAARRYGATHLVNSSAGDVAAAIKAIAPDGLDHAVDTTGREDVLRQAVELLGPLGSAGVIGIGPSESMSFEWRSVLNGRTITGIIGGDSLPQVFVPSLLELRAAGKFPVDDMITEFPFEEINEAVAAVKGGEVSKAVLTF